MSSRRNSLSPPEKTGIVDPGAHQLAESDSEEHYSDAQSGANSPVPKSPIPKTRVEKVDDEPSYGEVPGTEAYKMREGDAEPDEIAIIPDLSLKTDVGREQSRERALSPGGHPIPKTVVEESPDSAGSVEHTEDKAKHRADAPPDLLIRADGTEVEDEEGESGSTDAPISPALKPPRSPRLRRKSSSAIQKPPPPSPGFGKDGDGEEEEEGGDEFGDDFDDFEEGNEDDDFGEFDDGDFEQPEEEPQPPQAAPTPAPQPSLSYPIPDFSNLDPDDIMSATEPYLNALFPPDDTPPALPPLSKSENPIFLTPRSASLWSQLVAPPPLQPPDWIRSRIRRLFLVSLGVPIDLDEILPASKQKKLVLPSLHRVNSSGSMRTSTDSRSRSLSRLKKRDDENASSTSVDTQGKPKPKSNSSRKEKSGNEQPRRHKGPAEPNFDLVAAKQLCTTTDEALDGMTDAELQAHVKRLAELQDTAKEVLGFWTKRTDEKIGDREAFEGVIENLVKHARKVRQ
ncbi:hypothetical protein CONLIGDRAFT_32266 [Coniochaeta ligniaria NRRL 30616]|uniref:Uncharacterized protein n=1 Tax=Coniochaeta ligniaria NRRL 30616 TaxID=1408157 RepID=A0A1J7J4C0_9PEZI|nr:hypothetical protein CONLIGDRAFT_32266 [Coniochaeta ligniaria NRRL 30616]